MFRIRRLTWRLAGGICRPAGRWNTTQSQRDGDCRPGEVLRLSAKSSQNAKCKSCVDELHWDARGQPDAYVVQERSMVEAHIEQKHHNLVSYGDEDKMAKVKVSVYVGAEGGAVAYVVQVLRAVNVKF